MSVDKSLIEYFFSEPHSPHAVHFRQFTDAMPGGFLIYRASGPGEILYTNRALLRIFECETAEEFRSLTGNTFCGLVHPEDVAAVEQSIREQIAANPYDEDCVEYRIITRTGRIRWVEDYGHFVHSPDVGGIFYVFAADATEKYLRRQAELEQLNREHIRRMEVIRGLSIDYESLFYVDLDNGLIHPYQVGGRFQDIFRDAPDSRPFTDVTSEYIQAWVLPEDQDTVTRAVSPDNLRKRLINQHTYYINYRAGRGPSEYLQLRFVNVGDRKNISQIVLGCRSRDEEIRHGLEQNRLLETALGQARAANAIKDAFLSNMSHDLRTPMNAIVGFATLARNHMKDEKKLWSYLERIETASSRLLHLLDDVLEFSHLEAGDGQVEEMLCDLSAVAHNVQTAMVPYAEQKNILFSLEMDAVEHNSVYCDRHNLTLLLMRLTENAIKYTHEGGTVTVTFSEDPASPEYAAYHFIVKDNGIGISPDFLPRIFEPFERENNTTLSGVEGTGLGLTIVKSIVDLMSGTISVDSTPGVGSQFTVSMSLGLPRSTAGSPPAKLRTQSTPSRQGHHRILVVEDNEINLEIEMELLEDAGFQVDAAENGSIAVEKVRASCPGEYSLIIMDLQMPVMDGYSAAQAIRALDNPALAGIPIIALSANAFEEDRRKAIACGMNTHLPKPIDIAKLLSTIDELAGCK